MPANQNAGQHGVEQSQRQRQQPLGTLLSGE